MTRFESLARVLNIAWVKVVLITVLLYAILGFFRGNPDTQFVLTGAHCLKLELNGIERDGKQVSLLFRCKEVPFLSNDRFAGYCAGNSLGKDYHNLLHI